MLEELLIVQYYTLKNYRIFFHLKCDQKRSLIKKKILSQRFNNILFVFQSIVKKATWYTINNLLINVKIT